jgi:hypothetical protein
MSAYGCKRSDSKPAIIRAKIEEVTIIERQLAKIDSIAVGARDLLFDSAQDLTPWCENGGRCAKFPERQSEGLSTAHPEKGIF